MNTLPAKTFALAGVVLSLAASAALASAVAPNWRALEEAGPIDDAPLKAAPAKAYEKPAKVEAQPALVAANIPGALPAASGAAAGGGANPLARAASVNVTGGSKDATTTPPPAVRTGTDPWNGLQNTGPVPTFDNPAGCVNGNDAFSPNAPKCPAGFNPGQHPLNCGTGGTQVNLGGSVVCALNQVGMDQINGAITPGDRSEVQAFLVSRGLPESAAAYAVNAMNAPNLQGFACNQWDFVNHTPMSAFGEITWELILFDYVYGSLDPLHGTSRPKPAFCAKKFS